MRIKITENQYRGILNENRLENFINSIIDEWKDSDLLVILERLLLSYRFSLDIISNNDELKKLLENKMHKKIDLSNSFGKLVFINDVRDSLKHRLTDTLRNLMEDNIQGMLDELVNDAFQQSKNFIGAYKTLKSIRSMLPTRNYNIITYFTNLVKERGEIEGYTVIPKSYEWTFQKGGGQVQSIIDYIKNGSKKTRSGWQSSVGEDPKRRGWNSRLWSAMIAAGIVQSHRDGRDTIYTLGPNAESFEQGNLVGF